LVVKGKALRALAIPSGIPGQQGATACPCVLWVRWPFVPAIDGTSAPNAATRAQLGVSDRSRPPACSPVYRERLAEHWPATPGAGRLPWRRRKVPSGIA
jgi:hypothetical protein